jgi:dihydrofolate synthase/folylpolyglutamate synthase
MVKVTGTSGKGSVAAMLGSALESCGTRTGVFTSPHLVDAIERIRIGQCSIDESDLQAAFEETAPFLDAIQSKLGAACRPSFFEALLIVALRAFARSGVEVAILESAIGGYNDVVSLLPSRLSIITSIGLDHAAELGPTIVDVARDKAGIASPGSTLVLGPDMDAEALAAIFDDARARGVSTQIAAADRIVALRETVDGSDVRFETGNGFLDFRCPLRGAFQLRNLATVLATLEQLRDMGLASGVGCIRGVSQTVWPGRLEVFEGPVTWLLDAAHNVMSFEAVAEFVRRFCPQREKVLAFGVSERSKALDGLRVLSPLFHRTMLVNGFYKSFDMHSVASMEQTVFGSPEELVDGVLDSAAGDGLVVVTGSVYLVGACRSLLLDRGYWPRSSAAQS